MKNPIHVFIILAVVVFVGIGAYVLTQNSSQPTSVEPQNIAAKPNKNAVMEPKNAMMKKEERRSSYVVYSKSDLDQSADNRRVLFFYASWCPTCIPADEDLQINSSKLPEDLTVIRVNYNDPETDQEEKALANTYGITYQHTFVQIDSQGKEVTKWNGGKTNELLKNIK